MTIAELAAGGKQALSRLPQGALVALALILASTGSYGLGVLEGRSLGQAGGLSVTQIGSSSPAFLTAAAAAAPAGPSSNAPAALPVGGEVVASKSGTKYYFPWCGTVKNIKEENKVWFATRADAEKAGYEPATNCKGM